MDIGDLNGKVLVSEVELCCGEEQFLESLLEVGNTVRLVKLCFSVGLICIDDVEESVKILFSVCFYLEDFSGLDIFGAVPVGVVSALSMDTLVGIVGWKVAIITIAPFMGMSQPLAESATHWAQDIRLNLNFVPCNFHGVRKQEKIKG